MIKKIFWIFFAVIGMVMFVHVGGAYAETSDAVSTGNVGDAIDSIEMSGSIVQLESISFSTTDINLKIGESIDAKTAIIYSPIDTMDNPPLVWTSNDANIAQVDGTGNIIGVSPGTAVINASAGSIATSVIVNVTSLADIPVGNTSATDSTLLPTTIASPADPVTETAPTDTTTNTPPADPVTETAPIDSITGTLPVDTATEMPPADNIPDTSIVDSAAEVLPEENPLQVQTDTDSLVLDAQNPDSLSAAVILESETNAQLLFVFDDSRKTDITIAAPVLAASGFSGTAYVMTDPFWATVGFMTNADLEALYSDYGWDLGNHSLNHLDITDLNNQENMDTLVQEYLINQENLIANGWTRGAYHVAYANDVYNEELVQLLMQMGVLSARTFGTDTLMPTPIQDYYRLSIVDILSGLTAVKSQIDEAIRTNATIMLVTHGIADTAFGDKVSLADFQTIVNYVSQYAGLGQLEVKTISQWYADITALDASVPLEAITLDTTNFELTEGTSKTLVVSYSPTDTTDDLKVTWQSSNENVAYVDASGTVFAVGEGVAIITATVGKNTAQSYVTVTLPYRAPSASLLFTFDDGRTSTLTLGASILSDYGFVGTAYVMSDPYFSSTGRFLNVSELDILYNYYGWDIGNHTESHLVLPSVLSSSDITYFTQQYLNTQNWLLANGWTRAAYHAAYPNGYYNEQLINILKSIGVDSARLYGANGLVPLPVNDFYRLSMVDLVSGVSVVKSYIDAAVSTGSTIILTGHDIGTSASDSISISAFQEICAYVLGYVDKDLLNVTTISDWFNSQL